MTVLDLVGTTIAPGVRRKRGRPRSVDAHRRILNATLSICAMEGYRDLTIESVARTAGVGKSTIYRHWRSKGELIQEAIARQADSLGRNVDSGDLEKDLRTFVANLVELLSSPTGSAIAHLVGEAQSNHAVAELVAASWDVHRRGALVNLLESHLPDGEVRTSIDPERVSEAVFGSLFMRKIIMGATLGQADVDAVPSQVDADEIRRMMLGIPGVEDVHHLHVWNLSSTSVALSAHLVMREGITLHEAQVHAVQLKERLARQFGISHATLEMECHVCEAPDHAEDAQAN